MSLSRSPSPRPDGGWSSPGLTTGTGGSGTSTPRKGYSDLQSGGGLYMKGIGAAGPGGVSWAAAKAKSDQVRGYPSFSTRNNGFFSRQRRKISASLPRFRMNSAYGEKEKLGRGRWSPNGGPLLSRLKTLLGNLLRRKRVQLLLLLILMFVFWLVFSQPIYEAYRRSSLGGGKKIVLIVASNLGGGVMEWKGAREWAIERDSLRNKRRYELNTFIMELSLSVENHILKNLGKKTSGNITPYNPLNITPPPSLFYLDPLSLSFEGDGKES
ncbi:BED1 protein [Coccidioides immitis RMSCC 3703]|uniref:BED1 protein n=1 Tax=Coccidioides immitis RMSCC 3703 TaxID=454286 RepID=A0A0J8QXY9_COCIT|nr:BED1 protein [Coccidioides immitis RMSCC 3703]